MTALHAGSREPGTGIRILLVIFFMASGVVAGAQHEQHRSSPVPSRVPATGSPIPENPGWEPIRCWRQSSAGAITAGETFTMTLTCAVYEGDNAQVIPDESRLGVASIQLAPFEILGGSHPPDVHRGSRRFFQYDYQLRIISPDSIGHDVNLPPLTISYRIHSRVGAAATLEGRDLSYLLPMMPIKVLSLVPADAGDIRDASNASLHAVDALRFRANVFQVLTLTFSALAVVLLALALVPLARLRSAAATAERDRVPDRAVVTRAAEELADVRSRAAQDGWDDDAIARALAAARLVAAAAINQPISQKPAGKGAAAPEGRLLVRHGVVRPVSVSVSSAATPDDIEKARLNGSELSTTRRQQLDGLQSGLATLTAALYRKEPTHDGAELDDAVRHAHGVAKDIAAERSWIQTQWARR
jgi:hypothetical protein